jgi:hypothetical protein
MMGQREKAKEEENEVAEYIKNHKIVKEAESRSFLLKDEGGNRFHWYYVTWTPGQLFLSGDIDNLVITHYHALGNFEEGVAWAARSEVDYLLGKSSAKQEYDERCTVECLINLAEVYLEEWDDECYWLELGKISDPHEINPEPRNEEWREDLKKELRNFGVMDGPDSIYRVTGDPESICYNYTIHARLQARAVIKWAKLMEEELNKEE